MKLLQHFSDENDSFFDIRLANIPKEKKLELYLDSWNKTFDHLKRCKLEDWSRFAGAIAVDLIILKSAEKLFPVAVKNLFLPNEMAEPYLTQVLRETGVTSDVIEAVRKTYYSPNSNCPYIFNLNSAIAKAKYEAYSRNIGLESSRKSRGLFYNPENENQLIGNGLTYNKHANGEWVLDPKPTKVFPEDWVDPIYELIKSKNDVELIAQNTGLPQQLIETAKKPRFL